MGFFGMGMGEILLIMVIAIIIFGPGRIVDISRTLGRMMHNLKKATSSLSTQITGELEEKKTSASAQEARPLSERETK